MERRVTRIAVVQALYQIELIEEKDVDDVIDEFINDRNSLVEFDDQENLKRNSVDVKDDKDNVDLSTLKINSEMFKIIVKGTFENLADIDAKICEFIAANWSFERIERVLKSIIRAGVYEMLYLKTPNKVVFNEYIEVAKYFYGAKKDVAFVNGILNKIDEHYGERKNKKLKHQKNKSSGKDEDENN